MILRLLCLPSIVAVFATAAAAQDAALTRVLACKNDEAQVEVYLSAALVFESGGGSAISGLARAGKPVNGFYALDLSSAGKGKTLEAAKIALSRDKQNIVVEQVTRKLPPTTVPLKGGKASFDKRFAEGMTCDPIDGE